MRLWADAGSAFDMRVIPGLWAAVSTAPNRHHVACTARMIEDQPPVLVCALGGPGSSSTQDERVFRRR
jgi:hypothetical protein